MASYLWWSSKSCNGQAENLREKWISIIYHTINVHSWENATSFGKCEHNELSLEESQRKQWLKKCSPAHDALKSVDLNKKLLKDLDKLTDSATLVIWKFTMLFSLNIVLRGNISATRGCLQEHSWLHLIITTTQKEGKLPLAVEK